MLKKKKVDHQESLLVCKETAKQINLLFFNENVTRLAEKETIGDVVNAFIINKTFNKATCNVLIDKMKKYGQYDSRVRIIYNQLKDSKVC